MMFLKNNILLLLFVINIVTNVNAKPIKMFYELQSIDDIFPIIYQIKDAYKDTMDAEAFESYNTAIVWDIDGTITVEAEPILNQELVREQKEHAHFVADHFGIDVEIVIDHVQYFWNNTNHEIRLVEENIINLIHSIQQNGFTTFTCTASSFVQNDPRLQLMQEKKIDFSKSFLGRLGEYLDFFSPRREHIGHTSARDSFKAKIIDNLIIQINDMREIENLPLIKNLIFIDNFKKEAENVLNKCKQVENIVSFYYTHVKNNTSEVALIDSYVEYFNQFLAIKSDDEESSEDEEISIPIVHVCENKNEEQELNITLQDILNRLSLNPNDTLEDLFNPKPAQQLHDTIKTYVIPVIYDDQTENNYCLVKTGIRQEGHVLLFEPHSVPKHTPKHVWLSSYLENVYLEKFNLGDKDVDRSYNFYDQRTRSNIFFLNKIKISFEHLESIGYVKIPLTDFLSSIDYKSDIKIGNIKYSMCPSFLEIAFSLMDQINYLKYNL